jgi:hypothetical protein
LILAANLVALLVACAAPPPAADRSAYDAPTGAMRFESRDLALSVVETPEEAKRGSLPQDSGWLEYRIVLENRARTPLTLRDVKILSREGRYYGSAARYEEIVVPPDAQDRLAGDIARQSAGIAAGQVVPYGGSIVGLVSSLASASAHESEREARRRFAQRLMKGVELAPGGRASGAAFVPRIADPRALVFEYALGGRVERVELPLP